MRALVVATVLAAGTAARAEPLVLERGQVLVRLSIETNLDPRSIARPLSFAPDAWVGITDRLTVGFIHSNQSVDRIDAGASFCVRELANDCEDLYRGFGLDGRMTVARGVAVHTRLLMRDLDPGKPALTAGALVERRTGRFALRTDPYLRIGLGNRDLGNRDALVFPLWLSVHGAGGRIALHTGIDGDLAVWRDGWHVPLGFVIEAEPAPGLVVGTELGFTSLLGPQNNARQAAGFLYVELTMPMRRSAATARASAGTAAAGSPASRD